MPIRRQGDAFSQRRTVECAVVVVVVAGAVRKWSVGGKGGFLLLLRAGGRVDNYSGPGRLDHVERRRLVWWCIHHFSHEDEERYSQRKKKKENFQPTRVSLGSQRTERRERGERQRVPTLHNYTDAWGHAGR